MFWGHFPVVSWIIGIKFVRCGLQYGSNPEDFEESKFSLTATAPARDRARFA